MHTWQKFTVIAAAVAALHGAALWAVASYKNAPAPAGETAALLTRQVPSPQAEPPEAQPSQAALPVLVAPPVNTVKTGPALLATQPTPDKAVSPTQPSTPATISPDSPSNTANSLAAAAGSAPTTPSSTANAPTPAAKTAAAATGTAVSTNPSPKTLGTAAEPVYLVTPVYTLLMKGLEETGRVQISFEVNVDGQAINVRIAQSSGFSRLDEAALDAARKSRYKPASCGDKKVPSQYTRNYAFLVPALPDPPQPVIDCAAP